MLQRHEECWMDSAVVDAIDQEWVKARSQGQYKAMANRILGCIGELPFVLEVGCGTGEVYHVLSQAALGPIYYRGLDISEEMVKVARQRYGDRFDIGDIYDIPYGLGIWTHVICIHVLQHLPEYETPIRELLRVSRKGFYIATWICSGKKDDIRIEPKEVSGKSVPIYHNRYSYEKFIAFLLSLSDVKEIRTIHRGKKIFEIYVEKKQEKKDA